MRGLLYQLKGEADRAIADYDEAIRLSPKLPFSYNNRGNAYKAKGNLTAARADYDAAIKADPLWPWGYTNRGILSTEQKDFAGARADFYAALALAPLDADSKEAVEVARTSLAALSEVSSQERAPKPPLAIASSPAASARTAPPSKPLAAAPTAAAPVVAAERRVALVIGNSGYTSSLVTPLPNPRRDADLVAGALRQAGFQTVLLKSDLGRDAMRDALRTFRSAADNADWGVIYYAGHGLQIGKTNFLVPIDARLRDERDVPGETIASGELATAVAGAKGLRLIILDACRVNPFAAQMARLNPGRAILRGLSPPPESDSGMLIVYSAKDGEVAEDGNDVNSPFAKALVAQFKVPGHEVRRMFDYVREDVMAATGRRQQPYTYGSLPGSKDFFFVATK
jgi:hypothetical protein